jgi:hypothetical protein
VARPIEELYPASPPCDCEVCRGYCARPGWWTVAEAAGALEVGLGVRMMLELAPDRPVGVLAPAFAGNEGGAALQRYAGAGCTFLRAGRCELHGTHQPLECRACHHARPGLGPRCHATLERDWDTPAGQALVIRWAHAAPSWDRALVAALRALGVE